MKGILSKTENGWVVNYHFSVNNNDWETLPLHPDFIEMMDTCFTSKFTRDVEFEIVTETYEDGKGCTYAKLIHHSVEPKETLYTEEQVRKAISKAFDYHYTNGHLSEIALLDIIQSLKQPK